MSAGGDTGAAGRPPADDEVRRALEAAAHELRGPLSLVIGYLDLASSRLSGEEQAQAVRAARQQAERLTVMLDDLDALADPAPSFEGDEDVALDELCADVVASLAPLPGGNRLKTGACERALVRGRGRWLRRAVENLVDNALKYSPEDSPVTVGVRVGAGLVSVIVEDEGQGVGTDMAEEVFAEGVRLGPDAAGVPGRGLGLHLVGLIARSHGGRAYVEPGHGGVGSRFVLELPEALRA